MTTPDHSHSASLSRPQWMLVAAAAVLLVWHALYWFPEFNDDAFISFRYARNLALGHGLVYNPGERVEGFSNPLWVFLLAGAARLGATDLGLIAKMLGLVFAAGTLPLAALLCRTSFPAARAWWAVLPPLLLAASPAFASWAVWGLEVPLYAFLLTAAALLHARGVHRSRRGLALLAGVILAAALTRPEGILILALPGWALLRGILRRDRDVMRREGLLVGLGVLLGLVFVGWRWSYYGTLVPNTWWAKTVADTALLERDRGSRYLGWFLFRQSPPLTALLVLAASGLATARRFPAAAVIPALTGLFCAWWFNGDWMANYRFLAPFLPFLFVLAAGAPHLLGVRFPREGRAALLPPAAFLGLAGWLAVSGLLIDRDTRWSRGSALFMAKRGLGEWLTRPWEIPRRGFEAILWPQTRWVIEKAALGATVAMSDIGFLGYVTDARLYDTLALVNPSLAGIFHRRGLLGTDLDAALEEDFRRAAPDYAMLRRKREDGKGLNPLENALTRSPWFGSGWEPIREFAIGGGYSYHLYTRIPAPGGPTVEEVARRYREAVRWNPRVPAIREAYRDFLAGSGDTDARP
jgi:arabinofuranosyltransferase